MSNSRLSEYTGRTDVPGILMTVVSVELIYEINLSKSDCDEIIIKFTCETPLNESDTCFMISRYFSDEAYFDESDYNAFIRKDSVSEMRGVIRVMPTENNLRVKTGEYIIPIPPELIEEIKSGYYDPDNDNEDIGKIVERQFGSLFDKKGNLIIHS
ncbi:hypothetical protein AACK17_11150 [Pectobacterium punjabense]|uniref:hypothetical protein n=1 Tax=Pectobacterium punjabense TaxID=2108399 RepID=UPI00311DC7C5